MTIRPSALMTGQLILWYKMMKHCGMQMRFQHIYIFEYIRYWLMFWTIHLPLKNETISLRTNSCRIHRACSVFVFVKCSAYDIWCIAKVPKYRSSIFYSRYFPKPGIWKWIWYMQQKVNMKVLEISLLKLWYLYSFYLGKRTLEKFPKENFPCLQFLAKLHGFSQTPFFLLL